MNIANFIRALQHEFTEASSAAKARMIRFRQQKDFKLFLEQWLQRDDTAPLQNMVKILPSIRSLSCRLSNESLFAPFSPDIEFECDTEVCVGAAPALPHYPTSRSFSWGIKQVKAPQAWSTTIGQQIKIGVVDTGVDFAHPDLRHSLLHGVNLINRSRPPHDDNGHGTHIAGIIAASNRMHGMTGVAPGALLAPVKAFDQNGSAYVSDIIQAIEWCIHNRMNIINMSFGMRKRNKGLLNAVANAYQAGIIIVASSGNDGKLRTVDYPARYTQTISVGATSKMRRIAPFSNRGASIDIYAPGDKIVSAWPQGKYNEMSGTSMATSHVSGAIALLLALKPGLTPYQIKMIMKRSVQPLKNYKARRTIGELDIVRMLHLANKN
ncbi:S8 family peptidase [Paenibacillus sp. IITD108]|uniref:S8 family peptidase n=1 Tax=Paenibacillus sp. IITD108 TaxID=3116649 RepID=UPI002F40BFF0